MKRESLIEWRCEYWQFGSCSLLRADGKNMTSRLRSTSAEHTALVTADIGRASCTKGLVLWSRGSHQSNENLRGRKKRMRLHFHQQGQQRAYTCHAADVPWLNLKHKPQTWPPGRKCSQPNSSFAKRSELNAGHTAQSTQNQRHQMSSHLKPPSEGWAPAKRAHNEVLLISDALTQDGHTHKLTHRHRAQPPPVCLWRPRLVTSLRDQRQYVALISPRSGQPH